MKKIVIPFKLLFLLLILPFEITKGKKRKNKKKIKDLLRS